MRTGPLVAVVIPYYQVDPGILARALEGIAAQELRPGTALRVYIVDDSSPLPAEKELSGSPLADALDIVLDRQPNGGPGAARNRGLDLVAFAGDADYVAFLDSDDTWRPRHIADALAALEKGYDFYCCDNARPGTYDLFSEHIEILKDGGAKLAPRATAIDPDGPVLGFAAHEIDDEVAVSYISHTSTVVVHAGLVRDLRFDPELRNAGEDRMFWLSLALAGARIAISWRRHVDCGRGVNLFFSAYSWDSPATVERFGCELLFAEKLRRHRALTPARLAFAKARAARSRRIYAFLFLRMLLRLRRPPLRTFRTLLRFDPLLPARMPALFLRVFLDRRPEARQF
jgi:succinoglycan biosynthesis protein ExoW